MHGFDSETWEAFCIFNLVVGFVILFMTMIGCIGAVNQTSREGWCRGRTTLSLYQLCLIALLVIMFRVSLDASQTMDSIDYTLDSDTETTYDR